MRQILVLFFTFSSAFLAFLSFPAVATQEFPTGAFSELKDTGQASVTQIIAPDTIGLSDGRIVHLTGLDFPDLWAKDGSGPLAQTALRVLNDMLLGQQVRLHQTRNKKTGRVNRMQHQIAHVERISDGAWIQGVLVSLALARVRTTVANPEMAAQLYVLEADSRIMTDGLGLWSPDSYGILDALAIDKSKLNQYQIVEGIVQDVATNKGRIFVNFGEDWRDDFTVVIAPEAKRRFEKAGIDPMALTGAHIRARGWLEFYNGPNMEINHPERVEVLKASP